MVEIYTASQAIHNVDRLDQVDSDSNSHQVYLSSYLQRTVLANNDLQPPVLNERFHTQKKNTRKKRELKWNGIKKMNRKKGDWNKELSWAMHFSFHIWRFYFLSLEQSTTVTLVSSQVFFPDSLELIEQQLFSRRKTTLTTTTDFKKNTTTQCINIRSAYNVLKWSVCIVKKVQRSNKTISSIAAEESNHKEELIIHSIVVVYDDLIDNYSRSLSFHFVDKIKSMQARFNVILKCLFSFSLPLSLHILWIARARSCVW